ncbi:unnamed protein product [Arabidopsis thaliana]|uniref:Uncharacterized protein n=2 Tax=Arabidopsis thaliana TaxID=3702 RepID=A0A654GF30_ARATH|nr:uncharacterized protein AT2G07665 [Arabidopsis thaliana]ANM62142.1 hypothetical protein AT2G07665 [Arabidopsis thaliana]CAA0413879.1 unnamed protein product [Arabidopsis thaliana]VYS71770.1 unnamed protein product [Arabidopsis thaliana]|eukprot:NP_001324320.1 hypothetical protein AT2G07665 [Arabidopsis thaliana]
MWMERSGRIVSVRRKKRIRSVSHRFTNLLTLAR